MVDMCPGGLVRARRRVAGDQDGGTGDRRRWGQWWKLSFRSVSLRAYGFADVAAYLKSCKAYSYIGRRC
jgi:hypothetical protein